MSELVELSDEQEQRADRLHGQSQFVDALVADTAFVTDPEYRDNLAAGGVDIGNFTVGGSSGSFRTVTKQVVDFRESVAANDDRFLLVESFPDVQRAVETGRVGVVLGFQGTHPIGNDLELVTAFEQMGVKVIDPTYNTQNHVGAGCCEPNDAGLSMFGREFITELNERGIVIDTSHDGDQTTTDIVEHSADPVIQSHIGVRELCPAKGRCKTDEQLERVAENGGVNAITPFPPLIKRDPETHEVQPATVHDVLDHIDYVADLVGVEHVAFGGDMSDRALDRGTTTQGSNLRTWRKTHPEVYGAGPTEKMDPYPEGINRYPKLANLTRGLVARGYSDDEVAKILGGNLLRVFEEVWTE